MSKYEKTPFSPQEASADIGSLIPHLRRVQQQLQALASSSAQAQELDAVTNALQCLEGLQMVSKAAGESASQLTPVSQGQEWAPIPDALSQLDCHFVTNAQGLIQLTDQSAAGLLELLPNKIIGQNLLELLTAS